MHVLRDPSSIIYNLICKQEGLLSRMLHRNLRIHARPENKQLAGAAFLLLFEGGVSLLYESHSGAVGANLGIARDTRAMYEER